ncbi:MAG: hypothetical protein BWK73_04115 [Thiothrix lacustris]|uniref:Uncharacterized protein n=1 Tax=Thiothrix lacustris TaxID=525917 RepID=A0A1Y1QXZ3_9GAMM|nr:MAG: hypothetical protein BWK73_04115 [Thiothrix lacustris]
MQKRELFDWLLNRHVHEYMDVDGRPIGEGRSQAYAQVETKFRTCPYSGSRFQHEHPMNVSALNSILPEWQHSLVLLAWLSERYRQFHHTAITTYYDLALLSGTGVFLTDYMALRREQPLVSHQFPVLMSGLYKVCLGFQQATFLAMMNERFVSDAEKALPDAKGFYAWLEQEKLLIGPEEVCGGSEAMISRAYDAMRGKTASLASLESSLPSVAAMQIDWDAYDVFTFNVSELWRKAIWFVMQMRDFGITVQDETLPPALRDTINAHLQARFQQVLVGQSGLAVEIARLTLEESGRSLEEWLSVQADFLAEIAYPTELTTASSQLSATIMADLAQAVELADYAPVVVQAVEQQVARYEAFETAVLRAFNGHLEAILLALGYETAGELTAVDLSAMYGKTLRDYS